MEPVQIVRLVLACVIRPPSHYNGTPIEYLNELTEFVMNGTVINSPWDEYEGE